MATIGLRFAAMWVDTLDARSDFILATAVIVLGPNLQRLIERIPGYPNTGQTGFALLLVWGALLTMATPMALARYRNQSANAFGLDGGRSGLGPGVILALPIVAMGFLDRWSGGGDVVRSLLGVLDTAGADIIDTALVGAGLLVLFSGALLLSTFLTVRAETAFQPREVGLTEALRTYGMGAAGASLVLGLLSTVPTNLTLGGALRVPAAIVVLVLLADRLVPNRGSLSRAGILAAPIVVVVVHIVASGSLFGGGLLLALYSGVTAGSVVLVAAVLVGARDNSWAVIPMFLAGALYYPSIMGLYYPVVPVLP